VGISRFSFFIYFIFFHSLVNWMLAISGQVGGVNRLLLFVLSYR
jgi:hypothetical protein